MAGTTFEHHFYADGTVGWRDVAGAAGESKRALGSEPFYVIASEDVALRVRAEMLRVGAPGWDFRVLDNVNGDALYTLAGMTFNTGAADLTRNLHAESGWTGSGYGATRSAAPFAVLDVVYDAVQLVLSAAPDTVFPPLRLHWSAQNVPVTGTGVGEIGSSKYRLGAGIFLLGSANQDTDEYDRHVIAHEFGHYLEHRFSRSDSIGGPHTLTDQLDMRLAFGEGAELRRPLGIAIVGGLVVSQLLTLYTTPVVYLYLDRLRLWVSRSRHPELKTT